MDTHIASAPELNLGAGLSARLPGEPDPDAFAAADPSDAPAPLARASGPPRARRRRAGLLAGVAIGVVVLTGSGFVLSPYTHVVPLPAPFAARVHQFAAEVGLDPDRPFAPSASLASIHLPAQPSAVVTPRYEPKGPDQGLKEILAMHTGSHPPSASEASTAASAASQPTPTTAPHASATAQTVSQADPPPGFIPHEPGSPIAPPVAGDTETANHPPAATPAQPEPRGTTDITQAVVAAAVVHEPPARPASGQATTQATTSATMTAAASAPAAPPVATSAPAPQSAADAADRARLLQAGPMTDTQQVQVLELVTQIATMVHELKQQNASLRADFAKTQEDESARLKDFERRITLAEARNAVGAAEANPSQAMLAPPAPAATPAVRPISVTRASAALPGDVPAAAKRYRVQAASPGMAMLTEFDRGGGDGAQLQVTVGETIPGWGKVKSVAQRGTSWVVSTEHGVIE